MGDIEIFVFKKLRGGCKLFQEKTIKKDWN